MKKENTSIRLKKIMKERNLRQVDILNLTKPYCLKYNVKMNKSDLSQYVSGKTEPNQDKLAVLSMALDVSETWLMGYDSSIRRSDAELDSIYKLFKKAGYKFSFTSNEDITKINIKNDEKNIDISIHDYELLGRYNSLKQSNTDVTPAMILEYDESSEDAILEARLKKRTCKTFLSELLNYDCRNIIDSLCTLNQAGIAEAEKRLSELQYIPIYKLTDFKNDSIDIIGINGKDGTCCNAPSDTTPIAAHARTDKKSTAEGQAHDNAIMDDDSEWE